MTRTGEAKREHRVPFCRWTVETRESPLTMKHGIDSSRQAIAEEKRQP